MLFLRMRRKRILRIGSYSIDPEYITGLGIEIARHRLDFLERLYIQLIHILKSLAGLLGSKHNFNIGGQVNYHVAIPRPNG